MPRGFFAASSLKSSRPKVGMLPKCGACGLYKTCHTPKMPYSGKGRRGVLIVGESPGQMEDQQGLHFVGKSGQYLRESLRSIGVSLERDCWMTNALICRPPNNASATDAQISYCRPNLMATVRELDPNVIILLGGSAVKSFIGGVGDHTIGALSRWVGWKIPLQSPRVWVCPTWHPAQLMREKDRMMDKFFMKHLRQAFELDEKPWPDGVPDYQSMVEVILDTDEAARILRKMSEKGGMVAVDYEGTCLKPEYKGAEIICCSASWEGKKTIAYPWQGEAIEATRELLHGKSTYKIASNLKHEDRWTRDVFGRGVRNWGWDTMLAAHVLDNREGITGLKFQALVHLGVEAYEDKIKEFLASKKGNHINRVKSDVDIVQLMRYCGTDSLLEFELAKIQMKLLEEFGPGPHWK